MVHIAIRMEICAPLMKTKAFTLNAYIAFCNADWRNHSTRNLHPPFPLPATFNHLLIKKALTGMKLPNKRQVSADVRQRMIFPSNRVRIIIATKPVDFRKGHDGLTALVKNELRKDTFTWPAIRDGLLWRLPPYKKPPAVDIYLVTNPKKRLNRAEALTLRSLTDKIKKTPLTKRTYKG